MSWLDKLKPAQMKAIEKEQKRNPRYGSPNTAKFGDSAGDYQKKSKPVGGSWKSIKQGR